MLKRLFLLPELFLLLSIIAWRLYAGNASIDIHLHDTYFIFAGHPLFGSSVLAPFFLILFLSWILHQLLRQKGLSSNTWRWIQITITLLSLLAFVVCFRKSSFNNLPIRYYNYNAFETLHRFYLGAILSLFIFIVCQLSFWITAVVLLIKRAINR